MEQITKKSAYEVVSETIAYYAEHPSRRADDGASCLYLTNDGKKCAVGRCMEAPKQHWEGDVIDMFSYNKDLEDKSLDDLLKEEYRGHSVTMWKELQKWHDVDEYWNENGITTDGKARAQELLAMYKDK